MVLTSSACAAMPGGATNLSRDTVRPRFGLSGTWSLIGEDSKVPRPPERGQSAAGQIYEPLCRVTVAPAGTDRVTQQLPPMTAPRQMTVSPPRRVAPA